MLTMDIRIIVVAVLVVVAVHAEITIDLDITNNNEEATREGDTVTIRCHIRGLNNLDTLRIVRLTSTPDDGGKRHEAEISTNCEKGPLFQGLTRYSVTDCNSDNIVAERVVELTIAGVHGADSGDIGCKCMGGPDRSAEVVEYLSVNVPLSSLALQYREPESGELVSLAHGDTVSLDEGDVAEFTCTAAVNGSKMGPDPFSMTFSDDEFAKTVQLTESTNETETFENGLVKASYEKRIAYRSDTSDRKLNGQVVTCNASMSGYPPMAKAVTVQVRYAPVITCEALHHHTADSPGTEIACTSRMNPNVTAHAWTWEDGNATQTLTAAQSYGQYSAQHTIVGDEHRFSLVLSNVTDDDYRPYKLAVQNEVGSREHDLQLVQVTTTTAPPSSTVKVPSTVIPKSLPTRNIDIVDGYPSGAATRPTEPLTLLMCACTGSLVSLLFLL